MASLPSLVVPGYKDRRGWLIAFGVVEFLIAGFLLLMTATMALVLPSVPMPSGQPAVPVAFFLVAAGFYAALAAFFIAVGIGSMRARNWARIAMIAISSIWLAFGTLGTIGAAVIMPMVLRQQQATLQQSHPDAPPLNLGGGFMFFIIALEAAFMIGLPLIFLLFYCGKNVKATCQGVAAPAAPVATVPAPPISAPAALASRPAQTPPVLVLVLSALYLLSGLTVVSTALWLPLATVFGVVIRGTPGRLVMLAMAAVTFFCAWSFYKLRIAGWWVAVAFSIFGSVSGLVTMFRLDLASLYGEVYQQMGIKPPIDIFKLYPGLMTFAMGVGVAFSVVLFGLLLYAKRYFPEGRKTS